jgi:hypothetical protein
MTLVTSFIGLPGALADTDAHIRKRRQTSVDRASNSMLQLYRTNLEVRLHCLDPETMTDRQRQISAQVADLLDAPRRPKPSEGGLEWDEVYKLGRLMTLLFNGAQLRQEITRRLAELVDQKVSEADRFRREYEALTGPAPDGQVADDEGLRALLLRVIEALQWAAKRKYLERPIRKEATKKTLIGLLAAFLFLVAPYVLLSLDYTSGAEPVSRWWSHLALYIALISGALGAFFSRLILLQRDWSNLALHEVCFHSEWAYALLRAGMGICGALILYYFFQSGLINGSIFPHVDKLAVNLIAADPPAVHIAFTAPSRDLALLTVWCFLGGFSEVLVPGLLAKTERQFSQPGAPARA